MTQSWRGKRAEWDRFRQPPKDPPGMSLVPKNGIAGVYRDLMRQMGAYPVEVVDAEFNAPQVRYELPPYDRRWDHGVHEYLKELRDEWFNKDGSMKMTETFSPDARQGTKPRTQKMSVGEKWMQDMRGMRAHLYGQNAPGGRPLKKVASNTAIGNAAADYTIGAANSADGLLSALDEATGGGTGSFSGTIDISNAGRHADALEQLQKLSDAGLIDEEKYKSLVKSIGGENPTLARHPLLSVTDVE